MLDHKLVTAINKLDDTFIKQKSIASQLVTEHKQLQEALSELCAQADYDCPSQYRTEHFRLAMSEGYALLRKLGYFRKRAK